MQRKTGILTLPLSNNNYGGILQAYALQTYIAKNYDTAIEIIDRRYNQTTNVKAKIKKQISKLIYPQLHKVHDNINRPFEVFRKKHLLLSDPIFTYDRCLEYIERQHFTHLITGSDQVWRLDYAKDIYKDLILDFPLHGIKKASYAASFGVADWTYPNYTNRFKSSLTNFSQLSVREDSGVIICKNNFGLDATHNIDPTLLLAPQDYKHLYKEETKVDLLNYVLDQSTEVQDFITDIARKNQLSVSGIGNKYKINKTSYKNYLHSQHDAVEDWLRAFASARFIVTDSFHGVVFSILFNKPFITLGNKKRGLGRFESILKLVGLEHRLITDNKNAASDILSQPIDYDNVNRILLAEREKSKAYFDLFFNQPESANAL